MDNSGVRKKRGRPRGRTLTTYIGLRIPLDLLGCLDAWISEQPEPQPRRSKAILSLLKVAIAAAPQFTTPSPVTPRQAEKPGRSMSNIRVEIATGAIAIHVNNKDDGAEMLQAASDALSTLVAATTDSRLRGRVTGLRPQPETGSAMILKNAQKSLAIRGSPKSDS
jgi:hypothetical protein